MFETDGLTRSETTVAAYEYRTFLLRKRAAKDLGIPETQIKWTQLATWMQRNLNGYARSTWRQYKYSVIYMAEKAGSADGHEACELLKNSDQAPDLVKRSDKGAGRKQKYLSDYDLEFIENELKSRRGKIPTILITWLRAALLTGLRPQEWWYTRLVFTDNSEPALVVKNLKHTNGRAHGEYRTVPLAHVDRAGLLQIKQMMRNSKLYQYEKLYNSCAMLLCKVREKSTTKKKRNVTLYSPRHQYIANLKASGKTDGEIGALSGHASGTTNKRHYGRRSSGRKIDNLLVIEEEVARVKVNGGFKSRRYKI